MTLPQVAPELAARLANYDRRPRASGAARDGAAARTAPRAGRRRGDRRRGQAAAGGRDLQASTASEFRRIEIAQFRELLKADFGRSYLERCRATIEQETSLGFEGRARMNCAAAVLRTSIAVLQRKHRFSSGALADRVNVLSQAMFFDLATTSTILSPARAGGGLGAASGDRSGDLRV